MSDERRGKHAGERAEGIGRRDAKRQAPLHHILTAANEQRERAEPWERQDGERAPAYAAFEIYRDLEPAKRSYRQVAALTGKALSLIERWGSGYKWTARAEMWDRQRNAEALTEVRERHKRTARLAAQVLAHPAQLVASALNSDPLMAQQLIEEFQREVVRGRGLAAYERLMRIVDASSGALASMLIAERMANGMSSENVAIGAVGAVSDAFSDSDADDERSGERAAIINTALLRLSRLAGESSRTGLGSEQG